MKKNKLKLISLSTIMTICFATPINADEKTKPVEIEQVFTEADCQWYPGRIQSNDFSIKNNRNKGIKVDRLSIKLTSSRNYKTCKVLNEDSSEFKEISQNSIVTLKQGNKVLFKKNMSQLLEEKWTQLNEMISINPKSDAILNMTIDIGKEEVTNNAQAIESIFSISLTYKEYDSIQKPGVDEEDKDDNIENPGIDEEEKDDSIENPGIDEEEKDDSIENPEIDEEEKENVIKPEIDNGKLPQTGGIINSATLTFLGVLAIGTGLVIESKSSSRKGGKDNE